MSINTFGTVGTIVEPNLVKEDLDSFASLQAEFESVLTQYQQALNTYTTTLTQEPSKTEYKIIDNMTWWGDKSLDEKEASNPEDCKTMCASDLKCSGAVFESKNNTCFLRSGANNNNLTKGTDGTYAIMSNQIYALTAVKELNQQLIDLGNKLFEKMKTDKKYEEQTKDNKMSAEVLNNYYNTLINQQHNINKQINEYQTTASAEYDSSLIVNSRRMKYIISGIIIAIIVFLIYPNISNLILMFCTIIGVLIFIWSTNM